MYHYFRIIPRKQLGIFVIRVLHCWGRDTKKKAKIIASNSLDTNNFEIQFISQDVFLNELFKNNIIEIIGRP
jgi:hypothetical protein